jgi:hypothetical protein
MQTVWNYAYSRFVVKSGKGQISDSEDPGHSEEEPEPAVQEQTQLREKSDAPEKARTELGLKLDSGLEGS